MVQSVMCFGTLPGAGSGGDQVSVNSWHPSGPSLAWNTRTYIQHVRCNAAVEDKSLPVSAVFTPPFSSFPS